MTSRKVLISSQPGQCRIATIENNRLTDIVINRAFSGSIVGNIYLGRVEKVLKGLQAAFIDIGLERSGFLGLAGARLIQKQDSTVKDLNADYVKEGDKILVQVSQDRLEDKGPKLSLKISLPGRFIVFAPGQSIVKVSHRLGDAEERKRLLTFLKEQAKNDDGIIIRTAASGALEKDLINNLQHLRALWREIKTTQADCKAPQLLLDQAGSIYKVLLDLGSMNAERIIVDNTDVFVELERELKGMGAERLELHTASESLFESYDVEEQIDAALSGTTVLPSGGSVLIDEARALTAIDVNTGGGKSGSPEELAIRTNLEAIDTVTREIRLRNLSGLILIDFVSMRNQTHQTKVLAQLRNAVKVDPIPTHVLGFTKLGLIEMTRERRREPLSIILCGTICEEREKSALTTAFDALRQVRREAQKNAGRALLLTAAPSVINALKNGAREAMSETNNHLGIPLTFEPVLSLSIRSFHVRVMEKKER